MEVDSRACEEVEEACDGFSRSLGAHEVEESRGGLIIPPLGHVPEHFPVRISINPVQYWVSGRSFGLRNAMLSSIDFLLSTRQPTYHPSGIPWSSAVRFRWSRHSWVRNLRALIRHNPSFDSTQMRVCGTDQWKRNVQC